MLREIDGCEKEARCLPAVAGSLITAHRTSRELICDTDYLNFRSDAEDKGSYHAPYNAESSPASLTKDRLHPIIVAAGYGRRTMAISTCWVNAFRKNKPEHRRCILRIRRRLVARLNPRTPSRVTYQSNRQPVVFNSIVDHALLVGAWATSMPCGSAPL